MILLCGTWYGCVGVWVCALWWDERCDGFKNQVLTFSTEFFDWQIQSKKSIFRLDLPVEKVHFSTGSTSRKKQSKNVEPKKPDLGFSRKRPFRLTNPPFLTQSDSTSRKGPFSTGLFSNWIILVLIVSRVDFYSCCALPRGCRCDGVLLYCCMAVEKRSAALCLPIPREQRVLRARRILIQAGWWRWTLAESRQSYVCGVALSREPQKLQQG